MLTCKAQAWFVYLSFSVSLETQRLIAAVVLNKSIFLKTPFSFFLSCLFLDKFFGWVPFYASQVLQCCTFLSEGMKRLSLRSVCFLPL